MLDSDATERSRVHENCTNTAETHHIIAMRQKGWYILVHLDPGVGSGLARTLIVGCDTLDRDRRTGCSYCARKLRGPESERRNESGGTYS